MDTAAVQAQAITGGSASGSIATQTINDYNIQTEGIGSNSLASGSVLNTHIDKGAVTGGPDGSLAAATVDKTSLLMRSTRPISGRFGPG